MKLFNFVKDEDGAVTVDYVVLTAAVVAMAIAGLTTLSDNSKIVSDSIGVAVAAEKI